MGVKSPALFITETMEEIWREAAGFGGTYIVSDKGRVARVLTPSVGRDGYPRVHLVCGDNKPRNILCHRLVAQTFLPNPFELPCVNHKDEDKTNASVDNLEWCSYKYNSTYSRGKPVVCLDTGEYFPSTREAARSAGVHSFRISECCWGITEEAGGCRWEFI